MAIPDYQSLMLPFLKELEDGNEHPIKQTKGVRTL
jgi:restriction endonuclease Mrr